LAGPLMGGFLIGFPYRPICVIELNQVFLGNPDSRTHAKKLWVSTKFQPKDQYAKHGVGTDLLSSP
jgi:hypothetical protein